MLLEGKQCFFYYFFIIVMHHMVNIRLTIYKWKQKQHKALYILSVNDARTFFIWFDLVSQSLVSSLQKYKCVLPTQNTKYSLTKYR